MHFVVQHRGQPQPVLVATTCPLLDRGSVGNLAVQLTEDGAPVGLLFDPDNCALVVAAPRAGPGGRTGYAEEARIPSEVLLAVTGMRTSRLEPRVLAWLQLMTADPERGLPHLASHALPLKTHVVPRIRGATVSQRM